MKKSALVRIVIWSAVALLLAAVMVAVLAGGSMQGFSINLGLFGYSYANADEYRVGDFSVDASTIRNIDVDWLAGSVTIQTYDGNEIKVSEDSGLDDAEMLRYRISGDELSIKFCKSGRVRAKSGKDLVLLVPKNANLHDVDVSLVASDLEVSGGLSVDNFSAESVSGNIDISGMASDEIDLETISGHIAVSDSVADEVKISSTSGRVEFCGEANEVSADTVSGAISIDAVNAPSEIKIDTVSGNTEITLPAGTGARIERDTLSGKFSAFEQDVSGNGGTFGNSSGSITTIDADTVSGNVTVDEK